MKTIKELLELEYLGKTLTLYTDENKRWLSKQSDNLRTIPFTGVVQSILECEGSCCNTDYGLVFENNLIYFFD